MGSALSSNVDMASVKELVDKAIKEDKVLIFSKNYCPYCATAKHILKKKSDHVKIYEINTMKGSSKIQAYLQHLNGQSTVPHVYINGEFIGGCSELVSVPNAKLQRKIAAASAGGLDDVYET